MRIILHPSLIRDRQAFESVLKLFFKGVELNAITFFLIENELCQLLSIHASEEFFIGDLFGLSVTPTLTLMATLICSLVIGSRICDLSVSRKWQN